MFLHGMFFTNIQLDDFSPTLARLLEHLHIEEPERWKWAMMAMVARVVVSDVVDQSYGALNLALNSYSCQVVVGNPGKCVKA